jgi:hypothetical protein
MGRRPECAADHAAARVANGRPVERRIRLRTSAPVQRDAERQIVLGFGFE